MFGQHDPQHRLALALLRRQFGDASEKAYLVGMPADHSGRNEPPPSGKHAPAGHAPQSPASRASTVQQEQCSYEQVQKVLISFIQHGFVTYSPGQDPIVYTLNPAKIVTHARIPRCVCWPVLLTM